MTSRRGSVYLKVRDDAGTLRPDNVDATQLLSLAASYFELLEKAAERDGSRLSLTGLWVEAGSAAVRSDVEDLVRAAHTAEKASFWLTGRVPVPWGMNAEVERVRAALDRLDPVCSAKVEAGDAHFELRPVSQAAPQRWPIVATTTLRAKVARINIEGKTVAFSSPSEERHFTVDVSTVQLKTITDNAFGEFDISMRVKLRPDTSIERGELLDVKVISTSNPLDAWRTWFDKNRVQRSGKSGSDWSRDD